MGAGNEDELEKNKNLEEGDDPVADDDDPWEQVSFDASEESAQREKDKPAVAVQDPPAEKDAAPKDNEVKAEEKKEETKAGEENKENTAKSAETALEQLPKLEGDNLKRAQYLQDTLKSLVPIFLQAKLSEQDQKLKPEEQDEKIRAQMTEMREALQKEREAGVFGPATQEAYKQYINWLQKAVPETIRELDTLGLQLPPGTPIPLESDQQGRTMDPSLYKALAADERLSLDLGLKPGELPDDAKLDKLDAVFNWLAKANESSSEYRGKQRDDAITKLIGDNGLPEGWLKKPGDDPNTWRNSAEEMVDLSIRTRNYIEAMQSLYKASRSSDFPIELPRGSKLTIQDSSGKNHTVSDNQLNDPHTRYLLKNGTIKEVKLDLPQDLRQEDPANKEKIERLRGWLDKHGEKIDQAVGELVKLQENPDAVIMFGDQEVANGKALLNEKGEFVRLVSGKYTPKPGETVQETNLIGYDFQVEQIKEGPDAGKFKVTQTIQAENAPWYAYQNIRAFGIENVGKPMKVDEKIIGPEDFVPVRNGSKIELVKAKNLESFKTMQQVGYYGEKALTITLDVAMAVSGTIEVGAAIKGARLAAVGAEAALALGTREALWEGGKGLLRVGVAGAGIFNNAGARSHEWGRTVNTARGIYFLGDIGLGLASSGWNLFRAGKAAEAMSSAEKVHTIIRGREAIQGAEALEGIPYIRHLHKGTEFAFKATELGFAPVIIGDLSHQIKEIREHGHRDPAKDAVIQVGDGRGLQTAEKGAFDPNNAKSLEAARALVESYKDTLGRGRKPETQAEVKAILDRAKELMGPDASEEDRARFRQELFNKMAFTPDQIKQLELADPESGLYDEWPISNQQLHDLMDPEKRKEFPKAQAELAEKFMAEKDKDVMAAAQVAMLYMARDKDGKINPELAKGEYEVPEYTKQVFHEGAGENPGWVEDVVVKARKAEQQINTSEVVRNLQRDLEDPNLGNRGIVTGDVLVRVGGLTHQQYGGVLQDVLNNPKSTREDKLQALADSTGSRMAVIIDGVRYQESLPKDDRSRVAQERASGKAHGLTSEAMMTELERVAKEDKDPDVRAMSAALLYGLREKDATRRAELLSGFNTMLDQNRQKPGDLSTKVTEFLKNELKAEIPENPPELADSVRETKLNAALSLAAITDKNDAAAQKELTNAILKSFSPTNLALSNRVLEALMPERLAQLQKDDPKTANDLRAAAVNLLRKPDSLAHEKDMVKLLNKLEPLLKEGDVEIKRQLQSKLHDLLRASELNTNYAKYFPTLRAAAIDTLGSLGSRESLEVIRSHISAQPSFKLDGNDVSANEADAGVRLAAVRALEKLGDPKLRSIINELVDKETDPTVASQLRDVKFTQQRIEPGSREWKDMYERTRTDIIGFGKKYPYLDNFTHDEAQKWMKEKFPLLDRETMMERAKSAVDNATGWWFRRTSFEVTINHEEWKAYRDVHDQQIAQWKQLVDMAAKGGEDGNKAKMALYYIATQNGSILGNSSGLEAGAVKGYYNENHYHKIYYHDFKSLASRELADLAKSNCEGKDVVAKVLKDALTKNKEVPGYVSFDFLTGWRALGKPDRNGYSVPREELARVTAEALKLEVSRLPGAQADYLQKDLIEDLQKYGHRMVLPVLQAMVDEPGHIKKEVRDQAQAMIDNFMHSTNLMYAETKVDQTSSKEQRADRLRKALEDKNNAETTVQEIFNAYKDYKIKDADDPALNQLQIAMNDSNERVRLAAARILMNSELPNSNPAKSKALATLANITLTGSNPAYHKEAYEMLSKVKLEPDKPLFLISGDRSYKIESEGGKIKATEYKMQPGKPAEPSGYIYPNGQSFRFDQSESGQVTGVWENGSHWTRQKDSTNNQYTNEWRSSKGSKWHGDYTLLPNNEYRYQQQGSSDGWLRQANGQWRKLVATAAGPQR